MLQKRHLHILSLVVTAVKLSQLWFLITLRFVNYTAESDKPSWNWPAHIHPPQILPRARASDCSQTDQTHCPIAGSCSYERML